MGKKRSSSQIEKLPTTAPKDDQPPSLALKDNEKPLSQHPEEDKDEAEDSSASSEAEDSSASSSEAEEEDEEDEEDDDEEDDSPSKNTTPSVNPITMDDSDSGDEETDSDSEEELAPKLKSLNSDSKPLLPNKSKAEAKPSSSSAPARSVTKRPVDNDPKQAKKRKITAGSPGEDNKKSGDDSKKLFQRVFNEDDEMAIMKGLYDYITNTGNDPFKYHTAFYEFVKKSIHFKVTLEQLRDKMRRLKLRYLTKVKNGKTSNFPKENDRIMFEFGQKIWGNVAEEKGKPKGKLSKKEPAAKKPRTTTNKLVLEPDRENPGPSLALNQLVRFDKSISDSSNLVATMERGLELAEESEKEELKRRWEKVEIAELELFKMKTDLAVNQSISILEALK